LEGARACIRQSAPETADRWYSDFLQALLKLEERPETWSLAPEDVEFAFELRQFLFQIAIRRPGQPLITRRDI
jgi:hypothetical protein